MLLRSTHLLFLGAALLATAEVAQAQLKQPVKYVQLTVVDKVTGKAIADGGVVQVRQAGVQDPLTQPKINPGTGLVRALLDPSTEYTFHIIAPGYFITDQRYTTPAGEDYEEVPVSFQIEPIPIGKEVLSESLFAPGESNLRESAKLNEVVKLMKDQPGVTVAVVIVPDARAAAPVASPAPPKAKKKPKKGKKGATAVVDTVVAATPPPTPPPTVDLSGIGQARQTALREFFKRNRVGLDRVSWNVTAGTMLPYSGGTQPANVVIKISGVQPFEIETDN